MGVVQKTDFFNAAVPVWPEGLERERNIHIGFRTVFPKIGKTPVRLRLAGATTYRIFLNGVFVHYGPARGPHGFFRVDLLDLSERLCGGDNLLAIEVVGYNCNSFAYPNQPSFLQAELMVGDRLVAATGQSGFDALCLPERIQRVERYSFQRPFVEAYRFAPETVDWRSRVDAEYESLPLAVQPQRSLLPCRVARPDFCVQTATEISMELSSAESGSAGEEERYWWMTDSRRSELESFLPDEFELDLFQLCQESFSTEDAVAGALYDLGINRTGFLQMNLSCTRPVRLLAAFDEILVDGDVDLTRNGTLNIVYYELQPGSYTLESIEPYTFRYLKLLKLDKSVSVQNVSLREYVNPEAVRAQFASSDPGLNLLFEAGRETFRQNAVDIYMDCPSRERAGWLCDSFFTSRVEALLCGGSSVEKSFIENFALPERFQCIPDGMLPMCYPSDHPDKQYIPQWVMWLVLELEEYLQRTGDRELIDRMEPKVAGLFKFLCTCENSDGLLENLPGWNFLEWSRANDLTRDVNYPTNMLYARTLESAACLYDRPEWAEKAEAVHATVREQSFNGSFFVDNAVRDEKRSLKLSGECTEVCQYYAFFCGTASPEHFSNLWKILLEHFGPNRKTDSEYSFVHSANAFIGYYLRMELLSRYGATAHLLEEMKGYFLGMAERTGTLWEHCDERASCNHGFASHICVHLCRDILGIRAIDPLKKTVEIVIPQDISLQDCSGSVPVAGGNVSVQWERIEGDLLSKVTVPPGWTVL